MHVCGLATIVGMADVGRRAGPLCTRGAAVLPLGMRVGSTVYPSAVVCGSARPGVATPTALRSIFFFNLRNTKKNLPKIKLQKSYAPIMTVHIKSILKNLRLSRGIHSWSIQTRKSRIIFSHFHKQNTTNKNANIKNIKSNFKFLILINYNLALIPIEG